MPDVESLYTAYKDQGLKVVAVSNEPMDVIRQFRNSKPYTYPAYHDETLDAWTRYDANEIPATFVIDRSGIVRFHEVGTDPQAVDRAVAAALPDQPAGGSAAGS